MSQKDPPAQSNGELRVVVGVDGSPCAMRALDYAAHQADSTGALLDVVCVYGVLPAEDSLMIPFGVIHDDAAAIVRQCLDRVGEISPNVVAKGQLVMGAPGPSLVELSEGATALVVGTRGHGHLVGMLLGSVSEYVAHHAPCTTTIVR